MPPGAALIWIIVKVHRVMIKYSLGWGGGRWSLYRVGALLLMSCSWCVRGT